MFLDCKFVPFSKISLYHIDSPGLNIQDFTKISSKTSRTRMIIFRICNVFSAWYTLSLRASIYLFGSFTPVKMRKQIQRDFPINTTELPLDFKFHDNQLITIIGLVIIFTGYCNIMVLCFLKKRYQSKKSSKDLLQGHQAMADLMATVFLIPLEVGWAPTDR